ncbi:MAG: hypothetical protein QNJ54_32765 [Prochloraceae cyanobacterium]|nr:hypothetical protein [Prochloraceae cyanobacterium]
MTYTTQQLIEILDRELRANWRGQRILLSSTDRIDNPVIAKALDPQKLSKVFAYQDFRQQVHQYQRQHQVSGIVWRMSTFQGKSVRTPELHNQLIAVTGDKETLMAAKESILAFWAEVTEKMRFWLASTQPTYSLGNNRKSIATDQIEELIELAEWAEIDAAREELYLGLCWGNPQEHQYQWAYPQSGCYRIIAATDEPSSIKV